MVRIERDGKVPADNPFAGRAGACPRSGRYGHRNVQGAALHPATGELWTNEHGPKGGDELNRTLAGRNYGWPLVTYGTEYSGKTISESPTAPGIEPPVHYWVPSIATSGLLFYTGDAIPAVARQRVRRRAHGQRARRGSNCDGKVVHEERAVRGVLNQRVRDVEQGPDGADLPAHRRGRRASCCASSRGVTSGEVSPHGSLMLESMHRPFGL